MTEVRLCRVLGPVRVESPGTAPVNTGSPQQRLVLAALALAEHRAVSTTRLIAAVWGPTPPDSALVTLRTYVSRLRQVLGSSMVETVADGYALRGVELDVVEARRLAAAADAATAPRPARDLLDRALRLWSGEPLAGLSGHWAATRRRELSDWRVELLEHRSRLDIELGETGTAITELTQLCNQHPLRESSRRLLMLALYRTGRQAEALRAFEDYRDRLAAELSAPPSAELGELYRAILRADDALGATAPVERWSATRVPAAPADLTGRAPQLELLRTLLRPNETEPVVATVSGIGGVGKSALAAAAAHSVAERFDAGLLYADLRGSQATPANPHDILAEFLAALGMGTAVPDDPDERIGLYRSAFAGRRVLILLDDAVDTAQPRPLLPGAPGSAVLITGRTLVPGSLGVEHIALEPLSPDEAAALFVRATGSGGAVAEPQAVSRIVAACEHLPLLVRLAASLAMTEPDRPLADIAAALADRRRRLVELGGGEHGIGSVFASSYAKLDAGLAEVLRTLATAGRGTWTSDAAAVALGTDAATAERQLERLVDLRLLESLAPRRYQLPDLVRLYARGREPDGS